MKKSHPLVLLASWNIASNLQLGKKINYICITNNNLHLHYNETTVMKIHFLTFCSLHFQLIFCQSLCNTPFPSSILHCTSSQSSKSPMLSDELRIISEMIIFLEQQYNLQYQIAKKLRAHVWKKGAEQDKFQYCSTSFPKWNS